MNAPIWAKSYPPGVRWNADIAVAPVQSVIDIAATTWPDQPALSFMGRSISAIDFNCLSHRA